MRVISVPVNYTAALLLQLVIAVGGTCIQTGALLAEVHLLQQM
jgi:hypothetical protein